MWDLIVSVPDHCLSFYSEKDLGGIIDKSPTFTEHIYSKIKIANRNLGLIFRTFTYLDIFMNLYKSLVRPHLEYAPSVWSPVYKKPRRRTGLQLKMYIHVPQSVSSVYHIYHTMIGSVFWDYLP